MNAEQYAAYRTTDQWRAIRHACLATYGYRCQVCGCTSWRRLVDVHHLHYRNIGREMPEDLIPLCCDHHALAHNQPDGYDMPVIRRLRRECEEDRWDDPLPAEVRERHMNYAGGLTKARIVFCPQCHTREEFDPENPYCSACGFGISSAANRRRSKTQQDADFMGFTDSKLLHDAPSMPRLGDFFQK